jgi:hypothetical protein
LSSTAPFRPHSAIAFVTVVPNPECFGADTGGALTLYPTHREDTAVDLPSNIDTAGLRRERSIFAGIGRKFVNRQTDGLGGGCIQAQLRAAVCC